MIKRSNIVKVLLVALVIISLPFQAQAMGFFGRSMVSAGDPFDTMMPRMGFLSQSQVQVSDTGIVVQLESAIIEPYQEKAENGYYGGIRGSYRVPWSIFLQGVVVSIKNPTDKIVIVRWAESAINAGSFSGIPFMGGMKYVDAGNPSATSDTIVAPGQTIRKKAYISRVNYEYSLVQGEPISTSNTMTINLTLKLSDGQSKVQYLTLTSPAIGMK